MTYRKVFYRFYFPVIHRHRTLWQVAFVLTLTVAARYGWPPVLALALLWLAVPRLFWHWMNRVLPA